MPLYDASIEWLKKHGLNGRDANRLLRALGTLADFEGTVKEALVEMGHQQGAHGKVCDALRHLVDADRKESCSK